MADKCIFRRNKSGCRKAIRVDLNLNLEPMLLKKEFKSEMNDLKTLSIEKRTVTELTEADMASIDGGTTPWCVVTLIVTLTLIPTDAS